MFEYITTLEGAPGLGTVDIFNNTNAASPAYLAMQGRKQGPDAETRTSVTFGDLFELFKAIRSDDDTALAWSPFS